MIKVFLVQKEVGVREEMGDGIQWEQEGYELVGEAGDGELAYPVILKEKPDILITDIEMPFMGGLELAGLVRAELPDTKIIMISESDEFEYVRQAIRIGVEEYLLRPVSSVELFKVLSRVSESVRQEQEKKELLEKYEEDMWENREYRKEEFLIRILTRSLSVTEILEQARRMEMDLSARIYNTIFLKISIRAGEGDEDGSNSIADVFTDVERALEQQSGIYYFRRGIEGWVVLCLADDPEQLDDQVRLVGEEVNRITNDCPLQLEYFGAVGKPVKRLGELKESVDEAERVFAHRYLGKWNQVMDGRNILREARPDTEFDLVSLGAAGHSREAAETFMRTGLKDEVTNFVNESFKMLGEANMQSSFFRQYVTMDVYLTAITVLESLGYDSHELVARCGDFSDMARAFQNVELARKYVIRVFEVTIDLRESVSRFTNTTLVKAARSYIDHNYDNEEISLNTVAATVNLSPNYFSTIFSQEMGLTFIEYLTYVRMKKAKELLRGSSMKTSEIAYAVGYKDAHYFSHLFKKTQKCTPREFRIAGVVGNKREKNKIKK